MAAPTSIQVDMLVRRMFGFDVCKTNWTTSVGWMQGSLQSSGISILERLAAPGPVDKMR